MSPASYLNEAKFLFEERGFDVEADEGFAQDEIDGVIERGSSVDDGPR